MARIRSVKPEVFRHARLYRAECESGLPLRLAFIALWTVADREGRFRWEPEEIKLDCLPYDDVDFSRVLDALATRGFIVRYTSGDRELGWIPSFRKHQVINNRESASVLPPPPKNINDINAIPTHEARISDASSTREARDTASHKGKGREREREKEGEAAAADTGAAREAAGDESACHRALPAEATKPTEASGIESACHRALPAEATWRVRTDLDISPIVAAMRDGADLDLDVVPAIRLASERAIASGRSIGSWGYFDGAIRDRHKSRLAMNGAAYKSRVSLHEMPDAAERQERLCTLWRDWTKYERCDRWQTEWGPRPGEPGCRIPAATLQANGIDPATGEDVSVPGHGIEAAA